MIVAYLVVFTALMIHGSSAGIDGLITLSIGVNIWLIGPPDCQNSGVHVNCSSSAANDSVIVGDNVTLRCDISYSDDCTPPSFQWTDNRGNLITNATNTTTAGDVKSIVVIPAYFPSVPSVNFSATFSYQGENCTCIWTSPNTTVRCPDGFSPLPGSNTCYKIISEMTDWNMASSSCQQLKNNSYLVMITSEAEQSAIASYLSDSITGSSCTVSAYYYYGNTIWTSYHRKNDSCDDTYSPFIWKPTSDRIFNGSYSGWGPGQPNCMDGNDYCMVLLSIYDYTGFDVQCENPWCILCEYGPF